MARGLLAPLSPQEEITLRRIAHGSVDVDAQATGRLLSLALVERVHTSLRLTPLGRLRFNALPKAPLLTRKRSVQAASDYVAGIIEKAQGMAKVRATEPAAEPLIHEATQPPARAPDDVVEDDALLTDPFVDLARWKSRAEVNMAEMRRGIMEHRRRQERLCDDSQRRIALSRLLLKATVPVMPAWLSALQ